MSEQEAPILIVDERDNPIGAAPKEEVWAKGLIHRIVHVMVEDGQGNILLQKRAPTMRLYPNCWTTSASGHVDEGEDWEQAGRRETSEEIGLSDLTLTVAGMFFYDGEFDGKILKRFNGVYKTIVPHDTVFAMQASEVTETKWFRIDAAKNLPNDQKTPGFIEILERYY